MTATHSPLFASEVIACVGDGREPTNEEMLVVAGRIWTEGAHDRSIMAWGDLPSDAEDRLIALRAAKLALKGG